MDIVSIELIDIHGKMILRKRLSALEEEENTFAIYPNPTKELVNLRFEVKEEDEVYFELHDAIGRKVKIMRVTTGVLHTLKLDAMHQGVYIYRLVDNKNVLESGKLVIE